MGMFDWIKYEGPLPKSKRPKSRLRQAMAKHMSQSKSIRLWENSVFASRAYDEGCLVITVKSDGRLYDPDGNPVDWSGVLNFYGSGSGHRGWEFLAEFENGVLRSIRSVLQEKE